MGIFLQLLGAQNVHVVTKIFLCGNRARQCRMRRQIGLNVDINTAGRTGQVIFDLVALFPGTQGYITVGRHFEIVTPCFCTNTGAGSTLGEILVIKSVVTEHPILGEMALADTNVGGDIVIAGFSDPTLHKWHARLALCEWHQHIK